MRRQSGPSSLQPEKLLVIGRVLGPFGVQGWVKIQPLTDEPARFKDLKKFFLVKDPDVPAPEEFQLEEVKFTPDKVLAKIAGFSNPEETHRVKNLLVALHRQEARPLPANRFYLFDLTGLAVFNEEAKFIGRVRDVWEIAGGNAVIVLETDGGEKLIPASREVVRRVDLKNKKMTVRLIDGMLD
jgi:16S rRNA processing protein RimM